MEAAGVKQKVRKIEVTRVRLRCAKIHLSLPEATLPEQRRFQNEVIQALRGENWVPRSTDRAAWTVSDKAPKQRVVSRAIAKVNSFLVQLGKPKDMLEVDFWGAARAYVGAVKVTGMSPGPMSFPPPRMDRFLVWVERDTDTGVVVWLDIHNMAQGTQPSVGALVSQWEARL